jgi:hypothetical protein
MFIGHYAVALAAKKAAPKTSLGVLLAAAMFIDLVWPVFLLLGWEKVRIDPGNTAFTPLDFVNYPWSHSLVTTLGWAVLFSSAYWQITRYRAGALATGFLVLSHWPLDAIVHRPDLPLYPGGAELIGLGIWNSIAATLMLESLLFGAGLWLYARATRPRNKVGTYSFQVFIGITILLYVSAAFGAPPPNETVLAWVALGACLFPLWAGWFDRHRSAAAAG